MKTILLLFITLSLNSQTIFGYKIDDKDLHDQSGIIISGWASSTYYYFYPKAWEACGVGIGVAGTAGVAKEVIWDKWLGKGHPDFHDGLSTVFGGLRMGIISRIGFNEHEKKMLRLDTLKYQFNKINLEK